MNWACLRPFPWLDTRARFVAAVPRGGTLLDLGTSDGETLSHIAELRPDLRLAGADLLARPCGLSLQHGFFQLDFEKEKVPLDDASLDAITSFHLVEHLRDLNALMLEIRRLLKTGGRAYFETPHPKSLALASAEGPAAGTFPMNFYDDPTHVGIVPTGVLAQRAREAGLEVVDTGTSRNWLFAAAYPALYFTRPCRKKLTARLHWLGWSAYLIASRP
jgi:SAM-dependent methyltransferase